MAIVSVKRKSDIDVEHPAKIIKPDKLEWISVETAFKKRIETGVIVNRAGIKDIEEFLKQARPLYEENVKRHTKNNPVKVNTSFVGLYKIGGKEIIEDKIYLQTENIIFYEYNDIRSKYETDVLENILNKSSEFQKKHSGLALKEIIQLYVNINKYEPYYGGSTFVDLPKEIKNKKAIINVKNKDEACFAWAVVSALHPADSNSDRVSTYPDYKKVLKLEGIEFPMDLRKIPKFEKQNDLSINVYALKMKNGDWCKTSIKHYDEDFEDDLIDKEELKENIKYEILPVHVSENYKEKHIHLLMVEVENDTDYNSNQIETEPQIKYHFCWIKKLSALLGRQLSKSKNKKHICDRCLSYFYNEDKLKSHLTDCKNFSAVKSVVPTEENKWLKFKNFKNIERAPFVVYGDLECLTIPVAEDNNTTSCSKLYQKHEPYSVGYHLQCSYNEELNKTKIYRGPDCIQWFVNELRDIAENVIEIYNNPKPMKKLTEKDKKEFYSAEKCHICRKPFINNNDEGQKKCKDHCHLTGDYRGAAHNECNLNYKNPYYIPVVFHNLTGYDAHFIIKDLCEQNDIDNNGKKIDKNIEHVDLLPINKEKYKSFSKLIIVKEQNKVHKIKLRFIDSYQFMSSSLETLVENLELGKMRVMRNYYKNLNDEKFKLLTRKGVIPYDYIENRERLQEEMLPPKDKFYNKMKESHITDKDYAHASNVWSHFQCKTLGEYSDLYLKTDVLLLADVFENFRDLCLETYKLDAAHYYTAPGLGWDAMLSKSEVVLELLTDIDKLVFIENGIRGGLCQCTKRHATCNNKYYEKEYDSTKPSTYLMYYDAVNLYGWAMTQYLPRSGFKWLSQEEIDKIDITKIEEDSDKGYILKVDLKYPKELHDSHKDLPFCPEQRQPPSRKGKKLLATLYDKKEYVIHYLNLKQVLANGLELTKIHQVLEFNQSPWMKSYIELNTSLRKHANNTFEKDFYKLMNNSVFGKTMQNVRKMRDVKLVTKWDGRYGAGRYISKPNFKDSVIFNENLMAIELKRLKVYFNKPIYVGMAILDISKTKIYQFHYDYIKKKYGKSTNLLYTDTDSLIYEIFSDDIYVDIKNDAEKWYDTSDFPSNNQYGITSINKKVLGMMKDELAGQIVTHFASTGAKSYAYKVDGKDVLKKGDGEQRLVKAKGFRPNEKSFITYDDYITCIKGESITKPQNTITSKKHIVYSKTQAKIVIGPNDDKRYVVPDSDSYETLPYGHYSLNSLNLYCE